MVRLEPEEKTENPAACTGAGRAAMEVVSHATRLRKGSADHYAPNSPKCSRTPPGFARGRRILDDVLLCRHYQEIRGMVGGWVGWTEGEKPS